MKERVENVSADGMDEDEFLEKEPSEYELDESLRRLVW